MNLCKYLWAVLLTLSLQANAQEEADVLRQSAIDQVIELVSENLETEDLDFSTYLEDLHYYYDHPLNLNRASREELERLMILDGFQVQALLDHIQYTGKLLALEELQGIAGFDLQTIRAILPFVGVGDANGRASLRWEAIKEEGRHEMILRYQQVLEEMQGFAPMEDSLLATNPNQRYLGSPGRVFTRYRFRYLNNISIGATAEKDAGEQFLSGTRPQGFDFYSAHAYFGNYGKLKHAIIGDYQAQFGQGLTWWTGLAFGKSTMISNIKRTAREITPYVSADENNFMRGAAATVELGPVELTAFVSNKKVDANITALDSIAGDIVASEFSSFQSSGYHRTISELEDKDAIGEFNTGGHLRLKRDQYQLGVTGVYTKYTGNQEANTQLYRQFEPMAREFVVAGFDYQYMIRNVMGFGEVSQRLDGGSAFLNGAILSLDPRLDVSLIHRYYDPAYNAPRSNALGESTRNTNETGFYFGISSRLSPQWTFNGYYDLFRFPWLRFRVDAPSSGQEYLAQLEYRPNKKAAVYLRYRFEDKEENFDLEGQATSAVGAISRHWYRLNWQYVLGRSLSLRNRVEFVQVHLPEGVSEEGWLLYQDLVYKPMPARYELKLRYALFDTDGYSSRIYAYEHDVLYSFSVPAYYYRGSRFYVILGYDLSRWSSMSVRVSQTYYANRDENGSGLNTINGPARTEVKMQLHLRF